MDPRRPAKRLSLGGVIDENRKIACCFHLAIMKGRILARLSAFFVGLTALAQVGCGPSRCSSGQGFGFTDGSTSASMICQPARSAPIVQNAGLYNGFVAAGLIWGLFATRNAFAIRGP